MWALGYQRDLTGTVPFRGGVVADNVFFIVREEIGVHSLRSLTLDQVSQPEQGVPVTVLVL